MRAAAVSMPRGLVAASEALLRQFGCVAGVTFLRLVRQTKPRKGKMMCPGNPVLILTNRIRLKYIDIDL